ncbi:MAG TPA: methyltransferase domain-containing protein [Candidatus Polarisedimenticolaceae bacterium]
MRSHAEEVRAGERFPFGENWRRLLASVGPERIEHASASLTGVLGAKALEGRRFLDAGCGSGLFSLAASLRGARVVSFDFDPACVACAVELRARFHRDAPDWRIERGSVLDAEYLARLGTFDVVYSWGVLHHTGRMWDAIDLVAARVAPGGRLWIALYNDQGAWSRAWLAIKRAYNRAPRPLRDLLLGACFVRLWGPTLLRDLAKGSALSTWRGYARTGRGMSPWRDVVDWVGGLPFEVASIAAVEDFLAARGFEREHVVSVGRGHGCNEFVLRRR